MGFVGGRSEKTSGDLSLFRPDFVGSRVVCSLIGSRRSDISPRARSGSGHYPSAAVTRGSSSGSRLFFFSEVVFSLGIGSSRRVSSFRRLGFGEADSILSSRFAGPDARWSMSETRGSHPVGTGSLCSRVFSCGLHGLVMAPGCLLYSLVTHSVSHFTRHSTVSTHLSCDFLPLRDPA